jgi:hypothetical protein
MQKFRSKSDIVEAVQITESTFDAPHPNPEHVPGPIYDPLRRVVLIKTPLGLKTGVVGDWIIRGPHNWITICKSDVFARTYEPLSATVLRFESR